MRILIFIALLCVAAQGRGQIYINSYAFGAAISSDLLLDSVSGAFYAYSLRKLDKDYAGNCIMVRRNSDGDSTNIGFVNNYLDTTALKNFCLTAGTDTCSIRVWYDQSGNGRNAKQFTTSLQPLILANDVITYNGSHVGIRFVGTNLNGDNLKADTLLTTYTTPVTTFIVNEHVTLTDYPRLIDQSTASGVVGTVGTTRRIYGNTSLNYGTTSAGLFEINYGLFNGASSEAAANGATVTTGNSGNLTARRLAIGSGLMEENGTWNNGFIHEIIIYNSNKSADRKQVRDNMNAFYSVY